MKKITGYVKLQLPDMTGGNTVGLVKSFRGGLAAPGKTRVVIDVTIGRGR